MTYTTVNELVGKKLESIQQIGNERLTFHTTCGESYTMYHEQDCCESVYIEDICGDLDDLIGNTILIAEEISNADDPADIPEPEYKDESYTWTFYRFSTIKGSVTIRWYGSSNGYYSESVGFYRLT